MQEVPSLASTSDSPDAGGVPALRRRSFLAALAGLACGHAAGAVAAGVQGPDLADPEENLRAYIRLRGNLNAVPVYDFIRGSVYGLAPGQAARPLFKLIGAQRTTYTRLSSLAYRASTRYVGLLVDWTSLQPLQEWDNPFNGERCRVPVSRYGPMNMRFLSDRFVPESMAPDAPTRATRPWFVIGDVVHMRDEIVLPAPDGALYPKADMITFSGSWRDLANPALPSVPSRMSFTAVETWRKWMRMEQPGTLWWDVAGVKLQGPEAYPADLRARLRGVDPDFFASAAV